MMAKDSPFQELNDTNTPPTISQFVDYNGHWNMFLMFKPDGAGSDWVPLRVIDWSWHGTATLVNGSNPPRWTPNGMTEPGVPTDADSPEYPTWTQRNLLGEACNN